jgi:superfamily II DNA or RNA helicase
MELRPYQKEASEAIAAQWKEVDRTLLVLPTGCHARGERLLLASGESIPAERLEAGMRLMGMDGTPREVLRTVSGKGPLYKVVPVKGDPFVVSADHKLTLIRTNESRAPRYPCRSRGGEIIDVAVEDWLKWSANQKHIHKLFRSRAINKFWTPESSYPVDPYFLGVILGDGGVTTSINVTTPEPEIELVLREEASKWRMHLRESKAGKAVTYFFVSGDRPGRRGTELRNALVRLGVFGKGSQDKSIPSQYKFAPIETRLEVLAGLLDTDGSLFANGYDYVSKSKMLADDLAFLCRSVGLAAYEKRCVKGYGAFKAEYWRVYVSGDCSIIPCKVARKKASLRLQKKNHLRTGFSIEPAGDGEYFGATVDGDNRYLLADFTVTHNCGKTVVFSDVVRQRVSQGSRCLILAHRGELLSQAAEKLEASTGLKCSLEKAESRSMEGEAKHFRVTAASVQTMSRDSRLRLFPHDRFSTIVVDEAHHAISESYLKVIGHFPRAKLLGVTATPDRGDMKSLGEVFESLAYEYSFARAVREGWLAPIRAQTVPLQIDLRGVPMQNGDWQLEGVATALDPWLWQIASAVRERCKGRKTLIFLPLVETSKKFASMLRSLGVRAAEVNGSSKDRAGKLEAFERGEYDALCNALLLTEGYDCPSIDAIVCLRPTKMRSFYSQMVGRGTRLSPGKKELLLLDFLWMVERHQLCRPAALMSKNEAQAEKAQEIIDSAGEEGIGVLEAEEAAEAETLRQREEALAAELKAMRQKKARLVDPLQFEMSIAAEDLAGWSPSFAWESEPPTPKQLEFLEKRGIRPDGVGTRGKATLLIDRLRLRQSEGLSTPKQIRLLEARGFERVGEWEFAKASAAIAKIAANGWKTPAGMLG